MPGLFNSNSSPPDKKKKSGGLFKASSKPEAQTDKSSETLFKTSAKPEEPKKKSGGLFKPSSSTTSIPKIPQATENPFDTNKLEKSIANAKLRIIHAGGTVDKDERNRVEKALNLPEGQNWMFDALDTLNRPQQFVYGIMDGIFKGTSRTEGAMKGLKGEQVIRGSRVADAMGIKNKKAKAVAGFVIDVATDPLSAIPASWIGKAGKGAGKLVTNASKGTLGAAEKVVPPLKTLRETKIEPKLQAGKDALGQMFVPKYKWDETLKGNKDNFLKDSYIRTENDIRYMTENSLRNVTDAARSAGGIDTGTDVGRLMEKDLTMHGPRPARQYSTDPKVTKAANDLMKSNDDVRQWAVDNDIPVGEIEGYMRHILSAEEQAARKLKKPSAIDRPRSGMNNPDKKVLNSRELQGSAEDINDQLGRKFFEPNAYFSTAVGQKKLIEYGNAVKFRREVLDNPNFAEKFVHGTVVPPNATVINTNNYKFLNNPNNAGLATEIGGDYLVTHGVKQALDRYNKLTSDQGINAFLKGFDKAMSAWKRGALLSLPYHLRNDLGAKFNNYVGGMDAPDIAKYSVLADRDVFNAIVRGKESKYYNEFRKQGLGSNSQLAVEFAKHGDDADKALRTIVKDRSKTGLRKTADVANPLNVFKTSQELGSFVDQTNRFSLYLWAREAKKMLPEQAAAKVKEVQFDYTDLTPFEREVATRFIPFYRWSRNNIPFQLRQFAKNPAKYANANKLRQDSQEYYGIDDKNMPDYMKNSFMLPVSGDGKGSGSMLGANLPLSDLTKLSTPGKLFVDSINPLLKLGIELPSNRNLFFNSDIEAFKGQQKKYQVPEKIYGMNVPWGGKSLGGLPVKKAYALEQLGGQPVRGLSKIIGKPTVQEQENASLKPTLGISSMFKKYDINETNYRQKQKELRMLMDAIDYLEQEQGVRPKSVTDIKKGR